MQLGVSFPQNGVGGDIGAIREFVQTAEDLGYDYIFSGDHVLGESPRASRAGRGRTRSTTSTTSR